MSTPVHLTPNADEKPPGRLRGWLQAGGGFLLFSIVVHGVLLIGAAMWVVQTVQAKRKLNFSAAPPSSAEGSRQLEYRVQAARRTAAMTPPPVQTQTLAVSAEDKPAAVPVTHLSPANTPLERATLFIRAGETPFEAFARRQREREAVAAAAKTAGVETPGPRIARDDI